MYNAQKQVWFNPNIEYIFDTDIIEYDMKDAGFNLIKTYKLLPQRKIQELELLGKGIDRHITIGKLQRGDKEFSDRLTNAFIEMRTIFVNTNKLDDTNIISVKKDAVFTTKLCDQLEFGHISFANKNRYSSYIRFSKIGDIEIYYSNDAIDIKNLGEHAENCHRLYLLEFIREAIQMIEEKNPRTKRWIMDFVSKYKARLLDEEYYLKFDRKSREFDPFFNYSNVIVPMVLMICKEIPI